MPVALRTQPLCCKAGATSSAPRPIPKLRLAGVAGQGHWPGDAHGAAAKCGGRAGRLREAAVCGPGALTLIDQYSDRSWKLAGPARCGQSTRARQKQVLKTDICFWARSAGTRRPALDGLATANTHKCFSLYQTPSPGLSMKVNRFWGEKTPYFCVRFFFSLKN